MVIIKRLFTILSCLSMLGGLCSCSKAEINNSDKDKVQYEIGEIENQSADFNKNITVYGTQHSVDELAEFNIDCEWANKAVANSYVEDFLDNLDNKEFKKLYCRALALIHIMSTDNFILADSTSAWGNNGTYLEIFNEDTQKKEVYMESGYDYDSFYEVFCGVFTEETVETIFSRYPFFLSYNGELWYKLVSAGGNPGEIFQEYELIDQSDDEIKFKRISYSAAKSEHYDGFDPEKKAEYIKKEIDFRFVKTDNGWRAAEFLNATNYKEDMIIY